MKRQPQYTRHASGQARVRIRGKAIYLGRHGSPESYQRYRQLIDEWREQQAQPFSSDLTIGQCVVKHHEYLVKHYVKDGKLTSEVSAFKCALRHLVKLYSSEFISAFGPKKLANVRQSMIDAKFGRKSINIHVGRIRRFFRWCIAEEICPSSVITALEALSSLRRGEALETARKEPVPPEDIEAIAPFVKPQVWAMVQIQLLTGMRPGEVLSMRGCDLDVSSDVWIYTPERHKAEHHGRSRQIFLGPKAQDVIRPWLTSTSYLFPSGRGARYRLDSYSQTIRKACQKAGCDPWNPHRLRHNAATELRKAADLDTARTILGHASTPMTEHYAQRDACKQRSENVAPGGLKT